MKLQFVLSVVFAAVLILGFVNREKTQIQQGGCDGKNCHSYRPVNVQIKTQGNMNIKVMLEPEMSRFAAGAELIDDQGRVVDFQTGVSGKNVVLKAPQPGKYNLRVGYQLDQPFWDSLSVTIKPSVVNIPSARFSASSFNLFSIHPNPVGEAGLIRFILPHSSDIEMTIYTIAGKKVDTIFSGRLTAGIHSIYWEARDEHRLPLPAGVYLCELKSGSKKLVKKIQVER